MLMTSNTDMDWKKEHRTVWKQLFDKVSLDDIHKVWKDIPIQHIIWKQWGLCCDSYRSLVWVYLMKYFNVDGWERYKSIIDKYEKGCYVVCIDGRWKEYDFSKKLLSVKNY